MAKYEKMINLMDRIDDMQKSDIITEIQRIEIISILNMSNPEDLSGEDIRLYHDVITNIKSSAIKKTNSFKKEIRNLIYETFEKISMFNKLQFINAMITIRHEFVEYLLQNENLDTKSAYEGKHKIICTKIVDVLMKYPIDKLISIVEIQPDDYLEAIIKLFGIVLDQIEDEINDGGVYLTDTFKNTLKADLQQRYPTVGRNKLSILESPEKLNKEYMDYIKKIMLVKIEAYIQINFSNYKIFGDCINESSFYLNYLLEDNNQEVYEEFVTQYMYDLFLKTTNKKANCSQPKRNQTIVNSNNPIIESKDIKIKVCPSQINEFLNNHLNIIKTDMKTRREIRNYILRIHLNKKSIRIKDLIQNFPVTKDLFTEEFLSKATSLGISFKNGDIKKEETITDYKDKSQTDIMQETEYQITQVEDETKLEVEQKINFYLDHLKSFDGIGFICLMKLSGYQINHENYVTKCFNKLYHNTQMKQILLEELRKNIFSQEKVTRKKQPYWKINIYPKKGHRILFLEDNKKIDGIYNHDDYENRIANFFGN